MSRKYSNARPLYRRFFDRVTISEGCWEISGRGDSNGYPLMRVRGRELKANRLAWQLFYAPIPPGLNVLHRCDNPRCARPDHLFLGTQKDNMKDAVSKGRMAHQSQTHCKNGHEFTEENTRIGIDQGYEVRYCRACVRDASRRYREKRRTA